MLINASGLTGGDAEIQVKIKSIHSTQLRRLPAELELKGSSTDSSENCLFPVISHQSKVPVSGSGDVPDEADKANVESKIRKAQCIGLFFGKDGTGPAKCVHFIATLHPHVLYTSILLFVIYLCHTFSMGMG